LHLKYEIVIAISLSFKSSIMRTKMFCILHFHLQNYTAIWQDVKQHIILGLRVLSNNFTAQSCKILKTVNPLIFNWFKFVFCLFRKKWREICPCVVYRFCRLCIFLSHYVTHDNYHIPLPLPLLPLHDKDFSNRDQVFFVENIMLDCILRRCKLYSMEN